MTTKKLRLLHIREKIQSLKAGMLVQDCPAQKGVQNEPMSSVPCPFASRMWASDCKMESWSGRGKHAARVPQSCHRWTLGHQRHCTGPTILPQMNTGSPETPEQWFSDPSIQVLVLGWPPTMNYFHCHFRTLHFDTAMSCNVNTFGDRSFPKRLQPTGWELLL